jgi:hypothetical protein
MKRGDAMEAFFNPNNPSTGEKRQGEKVVKVKSMTMLEITYTQLRQ